MVDDIVRSEAHAKEGTGWVEVTGHARATVDILTNTLEREREGGGGGERDRQTFKQTS